MKKESYLLPSIKVVKTTISNNVCQPVSSLYGIIGQPGVYDENDDIIYDPNDIIF